MLQAQQEKKFLFLVKLGNLVGKVNLNWKNNIYLYFYVTFDDIYPLIIEHSIIYVFITNSLERTY